MIYPRCPYCGSESINEEYQIDRQEYTNFIQKEMGMRCLECESKFRLASGWKDAGWFLTDDNWMPVNGRRLRGLFCPKCYDGNLFLDPYSEDSYDIITRLNECECNSCGEWFKGIQEMDLDWWVSEDIEGNILEEVHR